MKFSWSKYIIAILFLAAFSSLSATHNRAGEITYEQIDDLTIRATITTYTRTSSFAADRDSLELAWGDGTSTTILRSNGKGTELPNDIKLNFYIAEHTYPTRGTYKLSMMDPNRIAGILNIDFPNSVNIPFYIETILTLLDTRFQGRNSSAILLQPPIDYACIDEIFTHNPNAYDPDGDSLAFSLVTPFQDIGDEVPNYLLPNLVSSGPDNQISLDAITGDFVWDSPKIQGEFNITIQIDEYREGVLINSIIRDMQILVRSCPEENKPPSVETVTEICVIAGETIDFEVIATDADSGQLIELTALGGPFEVEESPAVMQTALNPGPSPVSGRFIWETRCSHISKEYYQIVFKAVDNFFANEESGLATLKSVRIKVVGPPPQNVLAEKQTSNIKISWEAPYACENDDLFQGFSVWRKLGSKELPFDKCKEGLEGSGYEQIVFLTSDVEDGRYVAFDADVGENEVYCYRVLGEYAQLTDSGNPFNKVESLRSEESCDRFDRKDALITQVSVQSTNPVSGSIEINWLLPFAKDVDTLLNPGPYQLNLLRSTGISTTNFSQVPGASFNATNFASLQDTTFLDSGLNTTDNAYTYQLQFLALDGSQLVSESKSASSVFLHTVGKDELVELTWEEDVPWNNYEYIVYQKNQNGQFDSVGRTSSSLYSVSGLMNGAEYCFQVESLGRYNLRSVSDPLRNFSQESCTVPLDSIPPCPPDIRVETICSETNIAPEQLLFNSLTWSFTSADCFEAADLSSFNIYYSAIEGSPFELVENVELPDLNFEHQLNDVIAGCYVITAIDSSGNESGFSQSFCVDNCPFYELGNAFTPNQDQANDLFVPRINLFIDRVEIEIFNRWGQLVFETTDPQINWNGQNQGGKDLPDGTYYYTCKVFEKRVSGVVEQPDLLNGYIQLIRGR